MKFLSLFLRFVTCVSLFACAPHVVGKTPNGAEIVVIPLRLSNAYLIQSNVPVLIDAGTIGDAHDLSAALTDEGTSMRRVGLVVLTHAHADHAGVAAELQSFGARVVVGAGDADRLRRGVNDELRPTSATASLIKPLILNIFPETQPDVIVENEMDLAPWGIDGKVISMPGHTAGSLVVVLANHAAFVGDMMRGDVFGAPAEHYFHADREQNRKNIATLVQMGVERFYLGHGGPVDRTDVIAAFH